jgi:hypothetical protein
MTDNKETITCSKCRWPTYDLNDENVKNFFGYNRFIKPNKTCIKCRIYQRSFYIRNKEEIDFLRQMYPTDKNKVKETRSRPVTCPFCSTVVTSQYLSQHKKSQKCLAVQEQIK